MDKENAAAGGIKYSLLVPCYNASAYIEKFINHLSNLAKPFDEVIFYDDASTDDTLQILQSKGVKVIKGEMNRGPGFARNRLAEAAKGEYIHFHDIDDELMENYLDKTSRIAETGKYDVILCNVDWYDPPKKNLILSWKYSNDGISKNALTYTITNPIGGINGLYRKEKFTAAGGFNTEVSIWEDADLHVKLAAGKARFYIIEEVLSVAIRYANSASADQLKGWISRLNFLKSYYETFTDNDTRRAIGKQAQLTASKLIMAKQYQAAKTALQLSEKCNVKVPDNENSIWKLLKLAMPAGMRIETRMAQLKIAFRKSSAG